MLVAKNGVDEIDKDIKYLVVDFRDYLVVIFPNGDND
jgi:hypothetical protein